MRSSSDDEVHAAYRDTGSSDDMFSEAVSLHPSMREDTEEVPQSATSRADDDKTSSPSQAQASPKEKMPEQRAAAPLATPTLEPTGSLQLPSLVFLEAHKHASPNVARGGSDPQRIFTTEYTRSKKTHHRGDRPTADATASFSSSSTVSSLSTGRRHRRRAKRARMSRQEHNFFASSSSSGGSSSSSNRGSEGEDAEGSSETKDVRAPNKHHNHPETDREKASHARSKGRRHSSLSPSAGQTKHARGNPSQGSRSPAVESIAPIVSRPIPLTASAKENDSARSKSEVLQECSTPGPSASTRDAVDRNAATDARPPMEAVVTAATAVAVESAPSTSPTPNPQDHSGSGSAGPGIASQSSADSMLQTSASSASAPLPPEPRSVTMALMPSSTECASTAATTPASGDDRGNRKDNDTQSTAATQEDGATSQASPTVAGEKDPQTQETRGTRGVAFPTHAPVEQKASGSNASEYFQPASPLRDDPTTGQDDHRGVQEEATPQGETTSPAPSHRHGEGGAVLYSLRGTPSPAPSSTDQSSGPPTFRENDNTRLPNASHGVCSNATNPEGTSILSQEPTTLTRAESATNSDLSPTSHGGHHAHHRHRQNSKRNHSSDESSGEAGADAVGERKHRHHGSTTSPRRHHETPHHKSGSHSDGRDTTDNKDREDDRTEERSRHAADHRSHRTHDSSTHSTDPSSSTVGSPDSVGPNRHLGKHSRRSGKKSLATSPRTSRCNSDSEDLHSRRQQDSFAHSQSLLGGRRDRVVTGHHSRHHSRRNSPVGRRTGSHGDATAVAGDRTHATARSGIPSRELDDAAYLDRFGLVDVLSRLSLALLRRKPDDHVAFTRAWLRSEMKANAATASSSTPAGSPAQSRSHSTLRRAASASHVPYTPASPLSAPSSTTSPAAGPATAVYATSEGQQSPASQTPQHSRSVSSHVPTALEQAEISSMGLTAHAAAFSTTPPPPSGLTSSIITVVSTKDNKSTSLGSTAARLPFSHSTPNLMTHLPNASQLAHITSPANVIHLSAQRQKAGKSLEAVKPSATKSTSGTGSPTGNSPTAAVAASAEGGGASLAAPDGPQDVSATHPPVQGSLTATVATSTGLAALMVAAEERDAQRHREGAHRHGGTNPLTEDVRSTAATMAAADAEGRSTEGSDSNGSSGEALAAPPLAPVGSTMLNASASPTGSTASAVVDLADISIEAVLKGASQGDPLAMAAVAGAKAHVKHAQKEKKPEEKEAFITIPPTSQSRHVDPTYAPSIASASASGATPIASPAAVSGTGALPTSGARGPASSSDRAEGDFPLALSTRLGKKAKRATEKNMPSSEMQEYLDSVCASSAADDSLIQEPETEADLLTAGSPTGCRGGGAERAVDNTLLNTSGKGDASTSAPPAATSTSDAQGHPKDATTTTTDRTTKDAEQKAEQSSGNDDEDGLAFATFSPVIKLDTPSDSAGGVATRAFPTQGFGKSPTTKSIGVAESMGRVSTTSYPIASPASSHVAGLGGASLLGPKAPANTLATSPTGLGSGLSHGAGAATVLPSRKASTTSVIPSALLAAAAPNATANAAASRARREAAAASKLSNTTALHAGVPTPTTTHPCAPPAGVTGVTGSCGMPPSFGASPGSEISPTTSRNTSFAFGFPGGTAAGAGGRARINLHALANAGVGSPSNMTPSNSTTALSSAAVAGCNATNTAGSASSAHSVIRLPARAGAQVSSGDGTSPSGAATPQAGTHSATSSSAISSQPTGASPANVTPGGATQGALLVKHDGETKGEDLPLLAFPTLSTGQETDAAGLSSGHGTKSGSGTASGVGHYWNARQSPHNHRDVADAGASSNNSRASGTSVAATAMQNETIKRMQSLLSQVPPSKYAAALVFLEGLTVTSPGEESGDSTVLSHHVSSSANNAASTEAGSQVSGSSFAAQRVGSPTPRPQSGAGASGLLDRISFGTSPPVENSLASRVSPTGRVPGMGFRDLGDSSSGTPAPGEPCDGAVAGDGSRACSAPGTTAVSGTVSPAPKTGYGQRRTESAESGSLPGGAESSSSSFQPSLGTCKSHPSASVEAIVRDALSQSVIMKLPADHMMGKSSTTNAAPSAVTGASVSAGSGPTPANSIANASFASAATTTAAGEATTIGGYMQSSLLHKSGRTNSDLFLSHNQQPQQQQQQQPTVSFHRRPATPTVSTTTSTAGGKKFPTTESRESFFSQGALEASHHHHEASLRHRDTTALAASTSRHVSTGEEETSPLSGPSRRASHVQSPAPQSPDAGSVLQNRFVSAVGAKVDGGGTGSRQPLGRSPTSPPWKVTTMAPGANDPSAAPSSSSPSHTTGAQPSWQKEGVDRDEGPAPFANSRSPLQDGEAPLPMVSSSAATHAHEGETHAGAHRGTRGLSSFLGHAPSTTDTDSSSPTPFPPSAPTMPSSKCDMNSPLKLGRRESHAEESQDGPDAKKPDLLIPRKSSMAAANKLDIHNVNVSVSDPDEGPGSGGDGVSATLPMAAAKPRRYTTFPLDNHNDDDDGEASAQGALPTAHLPQLGAYAVTSPSSSSDPVLSSHTSSLEPRDTSLPGSLPTTTREPFTQTSQKRLSKTRPAGLAFPPLDSDSSFPGTGPVSLSSYETAASPGHFIHTPPFYTQATAPGAAPEGRRPTPTTKLPPSRALAGMPQGGLPSFTSSFSSSPHRLSAGGKGERRSSASGTGKPSGRHGSSGSSKVYTPRLQPHNARSAPTMPLSVEPLLSETDTDRAHGAARRKDHNVNTSFTFDDTSPDTARADAARQARHRHHGATDCPFDAASPDEHRTPLTAPPSTLLPPTPRSLLLSPPAGGSQRARGKALVDVYRLGSSFICPSAGGSASSSDVILPYGVSPHHISTLRWANKGHSNATPSHNGSPFNRSSTTHVAVTSNNSVTSGGDGSFAGSRGRPFGAGGSGSGDPHSPTAAGLASSAAQGSSARRLTKSATPAALGDASTHADPESGVYDTPLPSDVRPQSHPDARTESTPSEDALGGAVSIADSSGSSGALASTLGSGHRHTSAYHAHFVEDRFQKRRQRTQDSLDALAATTPGFHTAQADRSLQDAMAMVQAAAAEGTGMHGNPQNQGQDAAGMIPHHRHHHGSFASNLGSLPSTATTPFSPPSFARSGTALEASHLPSAGSTALPPGSLDSGVYTSPVFSTSQSHLARRTWGSSASPSPQPQPQQEPLQGGPTGRDSEALDVDSTPGSYVTLSNPADPEGLQRDSAPRSVGPTTAGAGANGKEDRLLVPGAERAASTRADPRQVGASSPERLETRHLAETMSHFLLLENNVSPAELDSLRKMLSSNKLFAALDDTQLEALLHSMSRHEYSKDEVLVREGDAALECLLVPVTGRLVVSRKGAVVRTLAPGQFFGEMALAYPTDRSQVTLTAADASSTGTTILYMLSKEDYQRLVLFENDARRVMFLQYIDRVPLLRSLSDADKGRLAEGLRVCRLQEGAKLVEQGEPVEWLYLLISGEVEGTLDKQKLLERNTTVALTGSTKASNEASTPAALHPEQQWHLSPRMGGDEARSCPRDFPLLKDAPTPFAQEGNPPLDPSSFSSAPPPASSSARAMGRRQPSGSPSLSAQGHTGGFLSASTPTANKAGANSSMGSCHGDDPYTTCSISSKETSPALTAAPPPPTSHTCDTNSAREAFTPLSAPFTPTTTATTNAAAAGGGLRTAAFSASPVGGTALSTPLVSPNTRAPGTGAVSLLAIPTAAGSSGSGLTGPRFTDTDAPSGDDTGAQLITTRRAGELVGEAEFVYMCDGLLTMTAVRGPVQAARISRLHFEVIMSRSALEELKCALIVHPAYRFFELVVPEDVKKEMRRVGLARTMSSNKPLPRKPSKGEEKGSLLDTCGSGSRRDTRPGGLTRRKSTRCSITDMNEENAPNHFHSEDTRKAWQGSSRHGSVLSLVPSSDLATPRGGEEGGTGKPSSPHRRQQRHRRRHHDNQLLSTHERSTNSNHLLPPTLSNQLSRRQTSSSVVTLDQSAATVAQSTTGANGFSANTSSLNAANRAGGSQHRDASRKNHGSGSVLDRGLSRGDLAQSRDSIASMHRRSKTRRRGSDKGAQNHHSNTSASPTNNVWEKKSSTGGGTGRWHHISVDGEIIFSGSRNLYRFPAQALKTNNSIMIAVVVDGTIIRWNSTAQRVVGYAPFEVVGRSVFDLMVGEESRQLLKVMVQTAKTYAGNWDAYTSGEMDRQEVFSFRQSTGFSQIGIALSVIPSLFAASSEVFLLIGREAKYRAAASYAADVARWLNTALKPQLQHFHRSVAKIEANSWHVTPEDALRLRGNLDACTSMVEQFSRFSSMNMESVSESWRPVRLPDLLRRFLLEANSMARSSRHTFFCNIDEVTPRYEIFLDAQQVFQILKMLLEDAVLIAGFDPEVEVNIELRVTAVEPDELQDTHSVQSPAAKRFASPKSLSTSLAGNKKDNNDGSSKGPETDGSSPNASQYFSPLHVAQDRLPGVTHTSPKAGGESDVNSASASSPNSSDLNGNGDPSPLGIMGLKRTAPIGAGADGHQSDSNHSNGDAINVVTPHRQTIDLSMNSLRRVRFELRDNGPSIASLRSPDFQDYYDGYEGSPPTDGSAGQGKAKSGAEGRESTPTTVGTAASSPAASPSLPAPMPNALPPPMVPFNSPVTSTTPSFPTTAAPSVDNLAALSGSPTNARPASAPAPTPPTQPAAQPRVLARPHRGGELPQVEKMVTAMGGVLYGFTRPEVEGNMVRVELPLLAVPGSKAEEEGASAASGAGAAAGGAGTGIGASSGEEDALSLDKSRGNVVAAPGRSYTVLVADNDRMQQANLCQILWARQHAVVPVTSYKELMRKIDANAADILIIDPLQLDITAEDYENLQSDNPFDDIRDASGRMVLVVMGTDFSDWRVQRLLDRNSVIELPKLGSAVLVHIAMQEAEQMVNEMLEEEERIELLRRTFTCSIAGRHKVGRLLGKGTFGDVYEVEDTLTGGRMAMKRMQLHDGVFADEVVEEILAMTRLQHENIIHYFYCEKESDTLLRLYMELAPGGTLRNKIRQNPGEGLPFEQIVQHLTDICRGLAYVHSQHYVHGDLKTANLLLGTRGRTKIGDFGTAKQIRPGQKLYTMVGTPQYMAPEVLNADAEQRVGYDFKADIWSVGCIALEMATGQPPFAHLEQTHGMGIIKYLSELTDTPDLSPLFSANPLVFEFVKGCLDVDPNNRPSAQDLFHFDILQGAVASVRAERIVKRAEMLYKLNKYAAMRADPDDPRGFNDEEEMEGGSEDVETDEYTSSGSDGSGNGIFAYHQHRQNRHGHRRSPRRYTDDDDDDDDVSGSDSISGSSEASGSSATSSYDSDNTNTDSTMTSAAGSAGDDDAVSVSALTTATAAAPPASHPSRHVRHPRGHQDPKKASDEKQATPVDQAAKRTPLPPASSLVDGTAVATGTSPRVSKAMSPTGPTTTHTVQAGATREEDADSADSDASADSSYTIDSSLDSEGNAKRRRRRPQPDDSDFFGSSSSSSSAVSASS